MGELSQLLEKFENINHIAEISPIQIINWLPKQYEFLTCVAKQKLFRAGNQAQGKTTAGLAEVYFRCIGRHPYFKVKKPPIEFYIICVSWSQSVAIQMKFWNIIDKNELDPKQRAPDEKNGFGDKNPIVRFANGSIVRFRTTGQGALHLAGATIDGAYIDEPTDQRTYSELAMRIMRRNGVLLIGLTPINAPEPLYWLEDLVNRGIIIEVWAPLRAEFLIPIGFTEPICLDDGTPMDQKWIDEHRSKVLPHEEPVIIDGEWETKVQGRLFKAFIRSKHSKNIYPKGGKEQIKICLGIDYGAAEREFAQAVILCAVDIQNGEENPFIYVLEEWNGDGTTTTKDIADHIMAMLKRHNLEWKDINFAFGDIPAMSKFVNKSNLDTHKALARLMAVSPDVLFPRILSAKAKIKQGSSMVRDGCQFLHQLMVMDQFNVDPRCKRLIKALEEWDYSSTNPLKDVIDALRYSLKHYIYLKTRRRITADIMRVTP